MQPWPSAEQACIQWWMVLEAGSAVLSAPGIQWGTNQVQALLEVTSWRTVDVIAMD